MPRKQRGPGAYWFKFEFKDFLLDRDISALPLEAQAILIRLWAMCGMDGSIPTNPAKLDPICGVPLRLLKRYWPDLKLFFVVESGGQKMHDPKIIASIEAYSLACAQRKKASVLGVNAKQNRNRAGSLLGTPPGQPVGEPNSEYRIKEKAKRGISVATGGQKDRIQEEELSGESGLFWADDLGG